MNALDTPAGTILRDEDHATPHLNSDKAAAPAVRAELQRVLASRHFETSKRCQAFLRYTVEQTLAGRGELKERTIGMEVFDRAPTYDTNQDPVVRMTAGEIRKRLALYYQSAVPQSEVRLELPVGGYVPRFLTVWPEEPGMDILPAALAASTLESSAVLLSGSSDEIGPTAPAAPRHWKVVRPALIALSLALVAGVLALSLSNHPFWRQKSAMDRFWEPLLAAEDPVLISIGQIVPVHAEVQPNHQRSSLLGAMQLGTEATFPKEVAVTVLGDSMTMANVAALLKVHQKPYAIRPQSDTNFADLQSNSVVLIGGFNNDWTINLTNQLRFHFATDAANEGIWIDDRDHPESRIGFIQPGTTMSEMKADYGVVVRMYNQQTKKLVVIVAGLTPLGTQAGGELLTDPAYLADYARSAPTDWSTRNMEFVYKTDLIDGEISPPQIVAASFW